MILAFNLTDNYGYVKLSRSLTSFCLALRITAGLHMHLF